MALSPVSTHPLIASSEPGWCFAHPCMRACVRACMQQGDYLSQVKSTHSTTPTPAQPAVASSCQKEVQTQASSVDCSPVNKQRLVHCCCGAGWVAG